MTRHTFELSQALFLPTSPKFPFFLPHPPWLQDPQPLRIQTCHMGDPISEGAWGPEGGRVRGGSQALAAGREAAQRLQGVLAGEWESRGLRRTEGQRGLVQQGHTEKKLTSRMLR